VAKPSLDDLRKIFGEELEDLLRLLSEQIVRAEQATGPADLASVVAELRRILHTLKGAARAVGFAEIESECHRLETKYERLAATDGAEAITTAGRDALDVLGRFATLTPASQPVPSVRSGAAKATAHSPVAGEEPVRAPQAARETVRVDATALEAILTSAEDLVLDMAHGVHRARQRTLDATSGDLVRELENVRRLAAVVHTTTKTPAGAELTRRLDRVLGLARTLSAAAELQVTREDAAWTSASTRASTVAGAARGLRQERFDTLASAAARAAREAAEGANVALRVVEEGTDVRFDRRIRDDLREILLHLVRNAVAHAIEPAADREKSGKPREGLVRIRAEEGDGELRILVSDDGRGIDVADVERRARELGLPVTGVDAIFASGLSTRSAADRLAGRGIGLDVVRQRVGALHGRIEVETARGVGTTFRIAVAPDLNLTRALVARAGPFGVAVRLSAVERVVRIVRDDVREVSGRMHVLHEGALVPLANVAGELGAIEKSSLRQGERLTAVVSASGERRVALVVDEISDEREIAVRPLRGRIRRIPFVSGTTVLSDGRPGWVLDMHAVASAARASAFDEEKEARIAKRVLVADDSATTRELERALLRAAGFDVEAVSDGEQAWQALTRGGRFDVVLSDVEMPRLDGFALLARIRATPRLADLPVVLVTALADPADKQRALDMGASAYIVKSAFDEDQLLDVIAHLV